MSSERREHPTFDVLDVSIHAVTPQLTIESVRRIVAEEHKGYLVFCTVSTLLAARNDERARTAIANAAVVAPDGMPLVWIGRRDASPTIERVYGPDFMHALFAATGAELRHYFYGGAPGVVEAMVRRLRHDYPDLQIAGMGTPPADLDPDSTTPEDLKDINASGADVVWVGLGHPKQEIWMHRNHDRVDAPVLAGVGAAFDFLSGQKREAPAWMKRSGLQWLHRLASEPRRLWRRYLLGNALFLVLLVRERIRRRVQ